MTEEITADLIAAQNPAAEPVLLRDIADRHRDTPGGRFSGSPLRTPVLEALAMHPNTPPEILAELMIAHLDAVWQNPIFDLLFLERPNLLHSLACDPLEYLLVRPDLPPALVAAMAYHPDPLLAEAARLHVGWDKTVGDQTIADRMNKWKEVAQGRVAALPGGPPCLLRELWELGAVPAWVGEAVKKAISHIPKGEPQSLCRGERLEGRTGQDRRPVFTRYPDREGERIGAAKNEQTPQALLMELTVRGSAAVRLAVARNPTAPQAALRQLFEEAKQGRHSWTRHEGGPLLVAVITNPNTPSDVLARIRKISNPHMRLLAVQNPAAPDALIRALATDPAPAVRCAARRVARERPSFEDKETKGFATTGLMRALREAAPPIPPVHRGARFVPTLSEVVALMHPWVGQTVIEVGGRSRKWDERLAVALNRSASNEMLQLLANDGIWPVRDAAWGTLARRKKKPE